jgi:uncharacterized ion transporter superfamily protein YfcC
MESKPRSLDPILLVGSIILLAAALTWIVPAGRYQRSHDTQSGRTLVVPGSYKPVPANPVGPWGVLLSIPQGLLNAAPVVFYIFLAGGALTVVETTGAIGQTLDQVVHRFGHRPHLILILASALFLAGGATYSMYEECLAFIPLLCGLMRRLKLDNTMAIAVSLGTATVAGQFSPVDTFHLGISQPMAQVPLFSGLGFRTVVFVFAIAIWGSYVLWYASRLRRGTAPTPASDAALTRSQATRWEPRDVAVLAVMNGGMVLLVAGAIFLRWEIVHFSALFVGIGFAAGLVGGLGWRGTAEAFAEGFRRLAFASILVGFARAISVVLENGVILDTIANALFSPLRHFSLESAAGMMFVSQSLLGLPMSSDSGRAMMSLPVLIPLADLLGLSRQMVVTAYHYGGLLPNLISPTAGSMLAMLALAEVPYGKWLRFVAAPFGALCLMSLLAMFAGVRLGLQ